MCYNIFKYNVICTLGNVFFFLFLFIKIKYDFGFGNLYINIFFADGRKNKKQSKIKFKV